MDQCCKCQSSQVVTEEVVAFTKRTRAAKDIVPKDLEGHFCQSCWALCIQLYKVIYKPALCSKAEALNL